MTTYTNVICQSEEAYALPSIKVADLRIWDDVVKVNGEPHFVWKIEVDGERRHLWFVPLWRRSRDQPHGHKVRSYFHDEDVAAA